MKNITALTGLALLLIGCGSKDAPYVPAVAPNPEPLMFKVGLDQNVWPFEKGRQWVYAVESTKIVNGQQVAMAPLEQTFRVTDIQNRDSGSKVTVDVFQEGKRVDSTEWLVNEKGIFQLSAGLNRLAFEPMQPMVVFPLDVGKKFNWKGVGPIPFTKYGPHTFEGEVMAQQAVDTATEVVQALPVRAHIRFKFKGINAVQETFAYFKPGVGFVRFTEVNTLGKVGNQVVLKLKNS
jgi:hypothetical protein